MAMYCIVLFTVYLYVLFSTMHSIVLFAEVVVVGGELHDRPHGLVGGVKQEGTW